MISGPLAYCTDRMTKSEGKFNSSMLHLDIIAA